MIVGTLFLMMENIKNKVMKANEAPERIWIDSEWIPHFDCKDCITEDSVEYIRKDAFIEKADEFIGSFFHPDDTELRNCLLKKFHEYMKGE